MTNFNIFERKINIFLNLTNIFLDMHMRHTQIVKNDKTSFHHEDSNLYKKV